MEKILEPNRVWSGICWIMDPACYQKSYWDLICGVRSFCLIETNAIILKDFCTINSQIKKPQKNLPKFPSGNLNISEIGQYWLSKFFSLHCFTSNHALQHQPKLASANLQSSLIFPVFQLWNRILCKNL